MIYKVRGQDDEIINISWCPQFDVTLRKTLKESEHRCKKKIYKEPKELVDKVLDVSGLEKHLPEDSFDASSEKDSVTEDDTFDIYTDHAPDEFGHKKYEPEEITVKVHEDAEQLDYLTECLKLKEEILKRKEQGESSITSLVEALENTHVDSKASEESTSWSKEETGASDDAGDHRSSVIASAHVHKHLLASISKNGYV